VTVTGTYGRAGGSRLGLCPSSSGLLRRKHCSAGGLRRVRMWELILQGPKLRRGVAVEGDLGSVLM